MAQLGLFPDPPTGPSGLRYQEHFVSGTAEQDLVDQIASLPLQRFQFGAFEGNRRVAWFGYRYDYSQQRLTEAEPVPGWLEPLSRQVETWGGLATGSVRQVLCTEYDVGVGIGWHRDKPHFDKVFGLSLGSPCKFRFRRRHGAKWERFTLDALPRSLYMMDGEARAVWEHSIPPVEARRYSITFRTMKPAQSKA
jgi:alkylated DNA repair dioxygenase AlkB